jgi:hypothetical protein
MFPISGKSRFWQANPASQSRSPVKASRGLESWNLKFPWILNFDF